MLPSSTPLVDVPLRLTLNVPASFVLACCRKLSFSVAPMIGSLLLPERVSWYLGTFGRGGSRGFRLNRVDAVPPLIFVSRFSRKDGGHTGWSSYSTTVPPRVPGLEVVAKDRPSFIVFDWIVSHLPSMAVPSVSFCAARGSRSEDSSRHL